MAIRLRQVRGVVLIAGALLVIAAVSFAYLRPPVSPVRSAPTTTTVTVSTSGGGSFAPILIQHTDLTGSADGGYFFWHLPGAGSGGHAN